MTRADGAPVVNTVDANPNAREWKNHVKSIAAEAYTGPILEGPIHLSVQFIMPRPKGHFRTGKFSHLLKDSAPPRPIGKPDITKLVRGLEDAITGVVWRDDSQVVETVQSKRYGDRAFTLVIIRELESAHGAEGTGMPHAQQGRAESAGDELQAGD